MLNKNTEEAIKKEDNSFGITRMSNMEFELFSTLIYSELGIKMPPSKKLMLTSRLNRRLKTNGINSFKEYYDYIHSNDGRKLEYSKMIDAVTTNKTDFYREANQFSFLKKHALPELISKTQFKINRKINLWSAGCSTGEEPYTIAMTMADYFSDQYNMFNILATDISKKVLTSAVNAVYPEERIKAVSPELRKRYLMKGKGPKAGTYRIVPELRDKISFRQLNFMNRDFGLKTKFDIIFCRNVVIYFDKQTQVSLFEKFYNQLLPGGFMFIGSSETLYGINDKFYQVGPNVYRKPV